jgi:hypothetical protein
LENKTITDMKRSIASWGIVFAAMLLVAGCTKTGKNGDPTDDGNNPDDSPAGRIQGSFMGQGVYTPQGVVVGAQKSCALPAGWESYQKKGTASILVEKITDSTVTMTLKTGPFPKYVFGNVRVRNAGDAVSWGTGSYSVNSQQLILSTGTSKSAYATTQACLVGLPYVYGWDLVGTGTYTYQTIDHVDFEGAKQ